MFAVSSPQTRLKGQLGFFGEPGVNVLELNLDPDVQYPVKK